MLAIFRYLHKYFSFGSFILQYTVLERFCECDAKEGGNQAYTNAKENVGKTQEIAPLLKKIDVFV